MSQTPDPRRWLALYVILSATLLSVIDFLIVNIALPTIKIELGATDAQMQLTVAGYGLAFAVCLITGGRLGDIYGRKRVFQIGMAGFTFASALCGFAQSSNQLVFFRVIQGTFAALMAPQVLATIQVTFAGEERDRATGFVGAAVGVGSFLGNVLGGYLVGANLLGLGWRAIFFVNLPIGVIALILAQMLVPESKSPTSKKLDLPGALISGLALFCVIFPIAEGRERGWPLWAFAMLGAAFFIARFFIGFERKLAQRGGTPLIDLELFQAPAFGRGLLSILLLFSGIASFSFVLTYFLQQGLGVAPQTVGLVFAALSVSFLISSLNAARILQIFGLKMLLWGLGIMQIGQLVVIALALVFKSQLTPLIFIPVLFFYGLGQGLCVPQIIRQTLNHVGGNNAGAASGVVNTTQQVAFSLGVSIVGAVFFAFAEGGNGDAYARGLAAAFAANFLFVAAAIVLIAQTIRRGAKVAGGAVAMEA